MRVYLTMIKKIFEHFYILLFRRSGFIAYQLFLKLRSSLFKSQSYYGDVHNAEITGPKFTAVFDSRDGLSVAREYGVQK